MYLYLPYSDDDSKLVEGLPAELLKLTGQLHRVMQLDIEPQTKLARVDAETVIASVNEKGYFLQMPPADLMLKDSSMLSSDSDTF